MLISVLCNSNSLFDRRPSLFSLNNWCLHACWSPCTVLQWIIYALFSRSLVWLKSIFLVFSWNFFVVPKIVFIFNKSKALQTKHFENRLSNAYIMPICIQCAMKSVIIIYIYNNVYIYINVYIYRNDGQFVGLCICFFFIYFFFVFLFFRTLRLALCVAIANAGTRKVRNAKGSATTGGKPCSFAVTMRNARKRTEWDFFKCITGLLHVSA